MRFKATTENLTIHVAPSETTEYIRNVVRHLVPDHTRKVYLHAEASPSLPIADAGIVLVGVQNLPSNFLQSFRIILTPGKLVVVSGMTRFTLDQWRNLAKSVEVQTT